MRADWLTTSAAKLPSAALLREVAVEKFGALAQRTDLAECIRSARMPADPECLKEWRRAVAEEVLLAVVLGAEVPSQVCSQFGDVPPLNTSRLTLRRLVGRPAAVAVIPIDDSGAWPYCAHLWLIEDAAARRDTLQGWQSLPAFCEIGGRRFAVHAVSARQPGIAITGESHQLATALLTTAMQRNSVHAIRSLALRWIVSGAVDGAKVTAVEIGNKCRLNIERSWLLPAESMAEIRALTYEFRPRHVIRTAATVATAMNIITQEGSRDLGREPWPENVTIMHSLVSDARLPVIAAALLTMPRKLILWHTHNQERSVDKANDIERLLARVAPSMMIKKRHIASDNIEHAERQLRQHDSLARAKNCGAILFNVTQGNRLTSYAVHTIARENPNIQLLYRDVDAINHEFVLIQYLSDDRMTTYVADGTQRAAAWPWLPWPLFYDKDTPATWEKLCAVQNPDAGVSENKR